MELEKHYEEHYSDSYFNNVTVEDKDTFTTIQTKPLMADLLVLLKKYGCKSVLEIGHGMGYNTKQVVDNGYDAHGIDFCRPFVKRASKKYGDYYTYHNIEENKMPNEWDCIYGFDVIEHLFDYNKALQNIHDSLNDNGILVLSTPNVLALRNRIRVLMGNYINFDTMEHIRFFSPKHLTKILEDNKFKVIDIKTYGRFKKPKSMAGTFMIIAQKYE